MKAITTGDLKLWNHHLRTLHEEAGWNWNLPRLMNHQLFFTKMRNQRKRWWSFCGDMAKYDDWKNSGEENKKFNGIYLKQKYTSRDDFYTSIEQFVNDIDGAIDFYKKHGERLKKVKEFVLSRKELIEQNNLIDSI